MNKRYKILPSLIIVILFFLAFAPPLNLPAGGWTQQFMPNLGGRNITDVCFLDSFTGWAVTNATNQFTDTIYVLKTINSGDNWIFQYRKIQTGGGFSGYFRVYFLNKDTGYACDVEGIDKTTNGGTNWSSLNAPQTAYLDMSILNADTIWIVTPDSFMGGVYFTSNGGINWVRQFSGGSQNPDHIYMYNARIGFMTSTYSASPNIYKTTNGGESWSVNVSQENFTDMYFADSLTGWKCMPGYYAGDSCVKKTTNGGINWIKQKLPRGGMLITSQIYKFAFINQDTIWGSGGQLFYGSGQYRGILYRTVNGGNNWLFQIPDTSFHIQGYGVIQFINGKTGWAYATQGGIHTTSGGNDTFYTGLQQVSNIIPSQFKLYQNYPNPFNPRTVIPYSLSSAGHVKIIAYDITGKEVQRMVDSYQHAGAYEVDFMGKFTASGVYFYRMTVDDEVVGTKKMILIK